MYINTYRFISFVATVKINMNCNGILLFVSFMAICSDGFIFTKKKVDCLVSHWGMWSDVFGFGVRTKERVILRYPDNGGRACPADTTITQSTGKHLFFT